MNYDQIISQKIQNIKPSGIRKFFDILEEMTDAISLGIGEPDFVTPWHIRDAGIYSLERGHTKYTSNAGMLELRREIANYLRRRFDLEYDYTNQILVTVGGSEAIDLALRVLVNPRDEVIIPVPSFVCYGPLTEMAGGVPVYVELTAENGFRLTPEQLKAAITPRTKALVLPFPSNPTGGIMERRDLEAIAQVLEDNDIMVISDEIYAELTYGQRHVSPANLTQLYDRTVVVNGFSKSHAMTGWRMGYVCGPAPILQQMLKLPEHPRQNLFCLRIYLKQDFPSAHNFPFSICKRDPDCRKFKINSNRIRRISIYAQQLRRPSSCRFPKTAVYYNSFFFKRIDDLQDRRTTQQCLFRNFFQRNRLKGLYALHYQIFVRFFDHFRCIFFHSLVGPPVFVTLKPVLL